MERRSRGRQKPWDTCQILCVCKQTIVRYVLVKWKCPRRQDTIFLFIKIKWNSNLRHCRDFTVADCVSSCWDHAFKPLRATSTQGNQPVSPLIWQVRPMKHRETGSPKVTQQKNLTVRINTHIWKFQKKLLSTILGCYETQQLRCLGREKKS